MTSISTSEWPGDAPGGRHRGSHRWGVTPSSLRIDLIHCVVIVDAVEEDVDLQGLLQRRSRAFEGLLDLIENMLRVLLDGSLEVRPDAREEQEVSIRNGRREQGLLARFRLWIALLLNFWGYLRFGG